MKSIIKNKIQRKEKTQNLGSGIKIALIITWTGIEDALVQQVHTQKFYQSDNFVEGKKFEDMLIFENGDLKTMDFRKFHEYVPY